MVKFFFLLLSLRGVLFATQILAKGEDKEVAAFSREQLYLNIGEAREVTTDEGLDLVLARRGIIDATPTSSTKWLLTGVKTGFVIADFRLSNGDIYKRYLVEVRARSTKLNQGKLSASADALSMAEVCSLKDVQCKNGILSGITSRFDHWQQSWRTCQTQPDCFFALRLSKESLEELRQQLKRVLGDRIEIAVTPANTLRVSMDCSKEKHDLMRQDLDQISNGGLSAGWLQGSCLQDSTDDVYTVRSRIVSIRKDALNAGGIKSDFSGLKAPDLALSALIESLSFQARQDTASVEVVAEPSISTQAYARFRVHSGGEFQSHKASASDEEHHRPDLWKRYGLEMEGKIVQVNDESIRVVYDLSLRNLNSSSFESLAVSRVEQSIVLQLGKRALLSLTDLQGDSSGSSTPFGLENIPILGPLFKSSERLSYQQMLAVWVSIEKVVTSEESRGS